MIVILVISILINILFISLGVLVYLSYKKKFRNMVNIEMKDLFEFYNKDIVFDDKDFEA